MLSPAFNINKLLYYYIYFLIEVKEEVKKMSAFSNLKQTFL